MWIYEKKLEYPVRVCRPNPRLAKNVITQYGGPDGELSASLRYLTQRYTMPTNQAIATLTDIGTEELAHMEIVAALYQLVKDAPLRQIIEADWTGISTTRGGLLGQQRRVPWTVRTSSQRAT